MPSVGTSSSWFVRIDGPHEFLKDKVKVVSGWIDTKRVLGCLHEGDKKDNPHVHFVIELTRELQKQSFDVRLKKLFGVSGTSYSSKIWDGGDGACGYMFHESDDSVCINKGFSDEDIERFRELNKATQKVIAVNKEKASGRVVNRVLAEANSEWSKADIARKLITMIREGDMYEPGDFMLKRYIEEIYCKSRSQEQFAGYLEDRIYRLSL